MWGQIEPTVKNDSHSVTYRRIRQTSSPPFSFISNLKEAELLAAPLVLQWKKLIEEAKHGMFSYFLMKGMEGEADANNDHQITAGELDAYVEQNAV